MRPLVRNLDVASNEYSGPYPLNYRGGDATFFISISGTCNLTVEGTNSDIQDPDVTATWFELDDDLTGITATTSVGLYAVPRAVRIKRNSVTSTPTVELQISQADR